MTLGIHWGWIPKLLFKLFIIAAFGLSAYYIVEQNNRYDEQHIKLDALSAIQVDYKEHKSSTFPDKRFRELILTVSGRQEKAFFNWEIYTNEFKNPSELKITSIRMMLNDGIEKTARTFRSYESQPDLPAISQGNDYLADYNDPRIQSLLLYLQKFLSQGGQMQPEDKDTIKKMCSLGLDTFKKNE